MRTDDFIATALDLLPSPAMMLEGEEVIYSNCAALQQPDDVRVRMVALQESCHDPDLGWMVCSEMPSGPYRDRPPLRLVTAHGEIGERTASAQHHRIETAVEFNETVDRTIRTIQQNMLALDASVKAQQFTQDRVNMAIRAQAEADAEDLSARPLTIVRDVPQG